MAPQGTDSSAILRIMELAADLQGLREVQSMLEIVESDVSEFYSMDEMKTDEFLSQLSDAFRAMKSDFSESEAKTIGKFIVVLIAACQ